LVSLVPGLPPHPPVLDELDALVEFVELDAVCDPVVPVVLLVVLEPVATEQVQPSAEHVPPMNEHARQICELHPEVPLLPLLKVHEHPSALQLPPNCWHS
jgi:hypothetical protein